MCLYALHTFYWLLIGSLEFSNIALQLRNRSQLMWHIRHICLHLCHSILRLWHVRLHLWHICLHLCHSRMCLWHIRQHSWHSCLWLWHICLNLWHVRLYMCHSSLRLCHICFHLWHIRLYLWHICLYLCHSSLHLWHIRLHSWHSCLWLWHICLNLWHICLYLCHSRLYLCHSSLYLCHGGHQLIQRLFSVSAAVDYGKPNWFLFTTVDIANSNCWYQHCKIMQTSLAISAIRISDIDCISDIGNWNGDSPLSQMAAIAICSV